MSSDAIGRPQDTALAQCRRAGFQVLANQTSIGDGFDGIDWNGDRIGCRATDKLLRNHGIERGRHHQCTGHDPDCLAAAPDRSFIGQAGMGGADYVKRGIGVMGRAME